MDGGERSSDSRYSATSAGGDTVKVVKQILKRDAGQILIDDDQSARGPSNLLDEVDTETNENTVYEGMVFESEEKAFDRYDEFARKMGFVVRRDKLVKRADGTVRKRVFVCFKQGIRKKDYRYQYVKKERPQVRTNCMARMVIKYEKDDTWVVSNVIYEHNHLLTTPSTYTLRSKRKIVGGQIGEAKDLKEIPLAGGLDCAGQQLGGCEDVEVVREKWALVYGRENVYANMTTTEHGRTISKFMKKFVKRTYSFPEFIARYEKAVESWRQMELHEDFHSTRELPSLFVPAPMLKQAADTYTRVVFEMFLEEYKQWLLCKIEEYGVDGTIYKKGALNEEVYSVAKRVLDNVLIEVESAINATTRKPQEYALQTSLVTQPHNAEENVGEQMIMALENESRSFRLMNGVEIDHRKKKSRTADADSNSGANVNHPQEQGEEEGHSNIASVGNKSNGHRSSSLQLVATPISAPIQYMPAGMSDSAQSLYSIASPKFIRNQNSQGFGPSGFEARPFSTHNTMEASFSQLSNQVSATDGALLLSTCMELPPHNGASGFESSEDSLDSDELQFSLLGDGSYIGLRYGVEGATLSTTASGDDLNKNPF
ncbi:hypothetical protein GIB67_000757 [Kingdonia uniflora]|uniref:FAR1 domain-containing protein n=1 Tax=Kingdonia uniflora TaxID=39325 RepID=A0A7J7NDK9_9MAGN|nr:hypothetical protein GIB67_000757 [Kingdonia uniflora]